MSVPPAGVGDAIASATDHSDAHVDPEHPADLPDPVPERREVHARSAAVVEHRLSGVERQRVEGGSAERPLLPAEREPRGRTEQRLVGAPPVVPAARSSDTPHRSRAGDVALVSGPSPHRSSPARSSVPGDGPDQHRLRAITHIGLVPVPRREMSYGSALTVVLWIAGLLGGFVQGIERALAPARRTITPVLSDPTVLVAWAVVVAVSVAVLLWDLRENNEPIASLMKGVWTLVVLYSGPFGLAIYWYAGRTQISHDSLWRRGIRSTAHCYSGCGAGEVVGVVLAQAVLGLAVGWVAAVTFGFAYLFGFGLTVGPLMQEGVEFGEAVLDALYSETPSITVMEVFAIGTDLLLASEATIGSVLFWLALAFSLSIGFLAAYPVNVALVRFGVKEGMMNPKEMRDDGSDPVSRSAAGD